VSVTGGRSLSICFDVVANWRSFLAVALMLLLAACGSGSVEGELPSQEVWEEENPQPLDGVTFHLVIDLSVADNFDGEHFEILVDDSLVAEGVGTANPEKHCNWYGPYELVLPEGSHKVSVTTGEGLSISENFDLTAESSGLVNYLHPGYDPEELDRPELRWNFFDGPTGCM
jgi:hypothetical protein